MPSENQRRAYSAFQQSRPTPEDRQWFYVGRTDSGLVRIRDARGNVRDAFVEGNRAITEGEPVFFIPPRPGQSLGVVQIEFGTLPPPPEEDMQRFISPVQLLTKKEEPTAGQQRGPGDLARVEYTENGNKIDKGTSLWDGEKWILFATAPVGYVTVMSPINNVVYPLINPVLSPLKILAIETRFAQGSATVSFRRTVVDPKNDLGVDDILPFNSGLVVVFTNVSSARGFSASFRFGSA
jgi:hypothetical protein